MSDPQKDRSMLAWTLLFKPLIKLVHDDAINKDNKQEEQQTTLLAKPKT